jgi:hypothetical protein
VFRSAWLQSNSHKLYQDYIILDLDDPVDALVDDCLEYAFDDEYDL